MAEVHWLTAINGSFTNPSDWSGGGVPGPSDDAILDAAGPAFTVTSSADETVGGLQLTSNAALVVSAGTFTAAQGPGLVANAGSIAVDHARFVTDGNFRNSGAFVGNYGFIFLKANVFNSGIITVNNSTLLLEKQSAVLSGRGVIDLVEGDIDGVYINYLWTNLNNTIEGSGDIGISNRFANDAHGLINSTHGIRLDSQQTYNSGLMEATDSSTLTLYGLHGMTVSNVGGVILAAAGSTVKLESADIVGGMLKAEGTGQIITSEAGYHIVNELDGRSSAVTIKGNLLVSPGGALTVEGAVVNTGVLTVDAPDAYHLGGIVIGAPGLTLSGGGEVLLADKTSALFGGALINFGNTIVGIGQLVTATLLNDIDGIIEARGRGRLTVNTTSGEIINDGRIEASSSQGLTILSPVENSGSLIVSAAILLARGAVTGSGSATILGGSLQFASRFNESVTFAGTSGNLELARSLAYTATLTGFSAFGTTSLDLDDVGFVSASEAVFSGTSTGGVLTVTDGIHTAKINLEGDYLSSVFVAASDENGGVTVVARPAMSMAGPAHAVVSAMARLGSSAGQAIHTGAPLSARAFMLSAPRVATA